MLLSSLSFGQSTTYKNNLGTNYMYGKTGNFNKSSFTWTITKNANSFNIKTNATNESFNLIYSRYDTKNKLHIYKIVGSGRFDGSFVKEVMTSGNLDDYANGIVTELSLLAILFEDNTGYIYRLGK